MRESKSELLSVLAETYSSTDGSAVSVENAISKQYVLGAEIKGRTVKNYYNGQYKKLIPSQTRADIDTADFIDKTVTVYNFNDKPIRVSQYINNNWQHNDLAVGACAVIAVTATEVSVFATNENGWTTDDYATALERLCILDGDTPVLTDYVP